jgi:hypothetical protein
VSGVHRGECRQAALSALEAAGHDLEAMNKAEVAMPSFPNDKTKEQRRLSALTRARKYQMDAWTEVRDDLSQDPQAKKGINVSPINNAAAAIKSSYGG